MGRLWLYDLLNFFFPVYCPVCGKIISLRKHVICLRCELDMPRASFRDPKDNPVARLFWGRTRIEGAVSFFRFEKGSNYQKLLHRLKYQGDKKTGYFLGKLLGHEIQARLLDECDLIIPVPLHPRKKRKRGFNQSEIIAKGASLICGLPVRSDLLFRESHTESQTRKSRFERFLNMEGVFRFDANHLSYLGIIGFLDGKVLTHDAFRILLLDDVVTTGSTLEACAESILCKGNHRVYIATVACA